jgi:hypothetical protein
LKRFLLALFLLSVPLAAADESGNLESGHGWDGNRSKPVHRLPLYDEDGAKILPGDDYALPFSTRTTCGPCHSYQTVQRGWHFSASRERAGGRPGEPWFLVDRLTGTQIPLSYRKWPGVWDPHRLGLSKWRFTQLFGRNMPGGDVADPEDLFEPGSRWTVSGRAEINCLACHNASPQQDHTEWVRQMARENFRWAATAAAGYGEVGGMASRLPETWLIYEGPNPDDKEYAVVPSVAYDLSRFDSKSRIFMDITGTPPDERCLTCHTATRVDVARSDVDMDVHTRAGIRCVDCHRNGLDHQMNRGYEGEAGQNPSIKATQMDFTCQACHLGDPAGPGGRLGAPRPQHKGYPAIHFDRLSCTACHSGVRPDRTTTRVRTSRANRLGVYAKALWQTKAPFIEEPVFAKEQDGRLAPHRIVWPAFWALNRGGELTPLLPEELSAKATGILDAKLQVGRVLVALDKDPDGVGKPVFVTAGKLFTAVDVDGDLAGAGAYADSSVTLWGRQDAGQVKPLVEFDLQSRKLGPKTRERLLTILGALSQYGVTSPPGSPVPKDSPKPPGEPALAWGDRLYTRNADGELVAARWSEAHEAPTWGWRSGRKFLPLASPMAVRTAAAVGDRDESFTEEQVAAMLEALGTPKRKDGAEYVYVGRGRLFRLAADGKLVSEDHKQASPYLWPLAHDVRPARQSLGVGGCSDCHSTDSDFFFARTVAAGPLKPTTDVVRRMTDFSGLDPGLQELFGRPFVYRPLLKVVLWVAAGIIAAVLLLYMLLGLRRFAEFLEMNEPAEDDHA